MSFALHHVHGAEVEEFLTTDDLARDRIRECVRATRYRGCKIKHAT
jgi:hypothetical protein